MNSFEVVEEVENVERKNGEGESAKDEDGTSFI